MSEGYSSFKKRLIVVEAASSEIGGGSESCLFVAASFACASAASFPGTLLCPGIHCSRLVLYNSANLERIVPNG